MWLEPAHFYDLENNNVYHEEIEVSEPRICLHCNNTGSQNLISLILTKGNRDPYSGLVITACSFCGCTSIHGVHSFEGYTENGIFRSFYEIVDSFPKTLKSNDFSDNIKTDFPDFFEIYNQSEEAEKSKLNHLAGMGYRKALEYLVTDFLKKYTPEGVEIEWLEKPGTSLKQKVDRIQNERIKKLATAITYLGNDQTHYTQRHPNYDVQSIKTFIKALVSNIEHEIALAEAEDFLNRS